MIAYDNFQGAYGKDGEGWAGFWETKSSGYNENSIAFGSLATSGGSIEAPYIEMTRLLAQPYDIAESGTVYISFLQHYIDYPLPERDSRQSIILLGKTEDSFLAIGFTHADKSEPNQGIVIQSGPPDYSGVYHITPAELGATYFHVIALSHIAGSTMLTSWTYTTPESISSKEPAPGSPGVIRSTYMLQKPFTPTGIKIAQYGITGGFDEIRIGTHFADVVPTK